MVNLPMPCNKLSQLGSLSIVDVWSANHFYYNGELFSCLQYSSLEAFILPPA